MSANKVIINGVACPLVDDDSILVSKRLTDIENPEQKTSDWTKQFEIKGTQEVNTLFGQIFNVNLDIQNVSLVNFTPDFNPNLKAKIIVMVGNMTVFNGFCQMLDIRIDKDKLIYYSINAYAGIGNLFNEIKTKFLTDIDLSPFNHAITRANVVSSWTPTLGDGYVYPMIDFGFDTSYDRWVTEYFKPAIFAKEYLDNIFADAGWSYESNFLTSTYFKSLIIPCKTEDVLLSNTVIYDRSFLVGRESTTQNITLPSYSSVGTAILFNADSGTLGSYDLHDTSGNDYNTGTGVWTCDENGTYRIGFSLSLNMENNVSPFVSSYSYYGRASIVLYKNGSAQEVYPVTFLFTSTNTSSNISINYTSQDFRAEVGNTFYLGITFGSVTDSHNIIYNSNGSNIEVNVLAGSVMSLIPQPKLTYGDTLTMNSLIPDNIKQTDFLSSIIKRFNLYVEETDFHKLKIEPREDYFNSDIVDWTTKVDVESIKLIPVGLSQNKSYLFTDEEDTDTLNKDYKVRNNKTYGEYLHEVTNDFLTEQKVIKTIFAPTPLSSPTSGENNRIISNMSFATEDGQNIMTGQPKIRLLYWGGLLSCNKWNFRNEQSSSIDVANDYTSYPYAGHLDNPYTPTLDINFGTPLNIYYDNNIGGAGNPRYTNNNVYNGYWRKAIEEITDKNSKVYVANFNLNIADYLNIDFKKQYFIKDSYYRLLEYVDYDLRGIYKTECRLLKTSKRPVYSTSSQELFGGTATFDTMGKLPTKPNKPFKDGRVTRYDKAYEGGQGYNTGLNTVNKGTGNFLPAASVDSFIFGSNTVKLFDERNFVFNSDNVTAVRAGAIFNGTSLEYKAVMNLDASFMEAIDNSTPIEVLPALASTEYYQINKIFFQFTAGTVDYLIDSGTGIITWTVNSQVTASMARSGWEGAGILVTTISIATITSQKEFGHALKMQINGNISAGDTPIIMSIFYNIITL